MSQESRVDSEWVALNAFRELLKLSTKGDLRFAATTHRLPSAIPAGSTHGKTITRQERI